MWNYEVEKKIATYLSLGAFTVTVFLLASTNTDPVNVPKLFALGGASIGVLAIALIFGRKPLLLNFKPILIALLTFDFILIIVSVASRAPFTQNYFGTFGRNTGALTYLLLSSITVASLLLSRVDSFEKIFVGFFAAGLLNVSYCLWVIIFGDFIPWNNPYGSILGLFGNPNFISSFLGMFITGSLAFIASPKTKFGVRVLFGCASIVAFYEVVKSQSIQGLVVTAGGISIVGFYVIRSLLKAKIITYFYAIFVSLLGLLAIFGTLQRGPLSFIYKRSVSFRGTYWATGIEIGKTHPLSGVGPDTYGDWYRRARPPVALIDTPGINTLTNASHNVVIDFFASGGFPLLLSYLAILVFGLISIIRVTARSTGYERVFVGIASLWLCYEVQSLISINQIGLSIWGWLLTGLLVAYEHATREVTQESEIKKDKTRNVRTRAQMSVVSPQLVAGIGVVIGCLIALPPLSADSKWFSATRSQDAVKVEAALVPSVFNPADSYRYAQAVSLFQTSNLTELAHKYAIIAVQFNPDYFDAWKQLYLLPNSTSAEKANALSNMKRLDPNNPDVIAN